MQKLLFILFLFTASFYTISQTDTLVLEISLKDKDVDDAPVKFAKLKLGNLTSSSDIEGKVYFKILDFKVSRNLQIKHPFYKDTTILNFNKYLKRSYKDTFFVALPLTFDGAMKDEVVLFANKKPDTIFGSEKESVADFELLPNGDIILLAYEKTLKKSSKVFLWKDGRIAYQRLIPGKAKELIADFRGNIHVVGEKEIYSLKVDNQQRIQLGRTAKDYYFKYLAPIVDTASTKYFFSNYNKDYPSFEYLSVDKVDTTYKKLMKIEDELMMELFRAEYKWVDVRTKLWAKEMENQSGIDKEVWVGANYFTQSVYYESLYAPLFMRNDSLFIFDHYGEQLHTLDLAGNKLDSVPIFYHKNERNTGWEKKLIQDKVTGQVFSIYKKAGYTYIKHIDTKTGKVSNSQKLFFRYIDKLEIRDNKIYYVYRPFESIQKKYLYKEDLKWSFEKSKILQGDEIVKK